MAEVSKEILEIKEGYEQKYGFSAPENYTFRAQKGLNEEIVRKISEIKGEPQWMIDFRLKALKIFFSMPMPVWGADLSPIDFNNIFYYIKPTEKQGRTWDEIPAEIKNTFDRLGIPEAEQKFLGGVGAQYESESVYHHIRKDLEEQGVVFLDMDSGLREYPEIVKKYFGKIIPPADNKFAALNSAVWSGGSFVYVPEGVKVATPLQAYFRINAKNMGQFERTLIITEPNSSAHYTEGCTAPSYSTDSLHAAVVEILAKENSKLRYTTIQNWSNNVYNLVTKRAHAHRNAVVEWIDGNLGSKITMKYPSVYLLGEGSQANIVSVAYAGRGQHQDAGGKAIHMAKNTSSTILSKSISKDGGKTTYRGLLKVAKGATGVKSNVRCDALILDNKSASDTVPYMDVAEKNVSITHEATVGKISEEQLFYLMSRGLSETEAMGLVVRGFIEPFTRELPMEYAVELNRLVQMDMAGAVG
ncbi:MAG: Fe-S cluster assembly protein SufB [Candidatus Aenigmarchaeota archaeon]|nr:Fe-S cluster assembly protein SufB [Candidatus Aenigmarchaeota archaeon]